MRGGAEAGVRKSNWVNGRLRRIFLLPAGSGEGPLTEPTTATRRRLWDRRRHLDQRLTGTCSPVTYSLASGQAGCNGADNGSFAISGSNLNIGGTQINDTTQ